MGTLYDNSPPGSDDIAADHPHCPSVIALPRGVGRNMRESTVAQYFTSHRW